MPISSHENHSAPDLLLGIKILIVDDEEDAVGLTKMVLEENGAEIFCAYDGEELWNGLISKKWNKPDLILLDLKMPKMDGFEVINKIKSNPLFHNIPILVFTAKVSDKYREEARLAGADGYITKPFVAKNLGPMIRELINSTN